MGSAPSGHPQPELTQRRFALPAWVTSVIFHVALLVLLGLTLQLAPRGLSADNERQIAGEIVLKKHTEQGDFYEDQQQARQTASQTAVEGLSELLNEAPAVVPAVELPSAEIGSVVGDAGGGGLAGLTQNPAGSREFGKGTKTKVFGIESQGHSFVYVFDRSASMSSPNNLPLNAAKAELKASLSQLTQENQFQIIFYADHPVVFNLSGVKGGLVWGNDRSKAMAERFINTVIADGGTKHKPALEAALRMGPDVIYFLTDALTNTIPPEMTDADLAAIRRSNRTGVTIHAIQFGLRPYVKEENWLVKLARQNNGRYTYVNVKDLRFRRD